MPRSRPCSDNMGLKKGPWTGEEDRILLAYIQEHGQGGWRALPAKAGLQRCGKSCRLRWINYLRPDIKRGKFNLQEEQTIFQLHALLGNRWSAIATHLPKRTDNEIKNYWNTHLKKRLTNMGIDPTTHKPMALALNTCQSKEIANIRHMAQWESVRLQAEARLARESKPAIATLSYSQLLNATTAPPPVPLPRPPCLDILKVWEWTNPGKDISSMILYGPENALPITTVRFFDGNTSINGMDCVGNSVGKLNDNYNQNEARGIMENSMELHHPIESTYIDDSLGFPTFVDGFDDLHATGTSSNALGSCWGDVEENKVNNI